ncbi:MAG: GtrA family protein [Sphingobium sp.]
MIDRRFFGFLVAGGINTALGYGVYGGLTLAGMPPQVALVCSTVVGVLFNFLTTGTVFGSRDSRLLPRFLAVYGVLLAANMALLTALLRTGIGPLAGQAIAVALFAPPSFLLMRRLVFAPAPESIP